MHSVTETLSSLAAFTTVTKSASPAIRNAFYICPVELSLTKSTASNISTPFCTISPGLGLIEFLRNDDESKSLYRCVPCEKEFPKSKIIFHFSVRHKDVFKIASRLLEIWDLIGSQSMEDLQVEKRYLCECGRSYSSSANLTYHRRKKGHRRVYDSEKRIYQFRVFQSKFERLRR